MSNSRRGQPSAAIPRSRDWRAFSKPMSRSEVRKVDPAVNPQFREHVLPPERRLVEVSGLEPPDLYVANVWFSAF